MNNEERRPKEFNTQSEYWRQEKMGKQCSLFNEFVGMDIRKGRQVDDKSLKCT